LPVASNNGPEFKSQLMTTGVMLRCGAGHDASPGASTTIEIAPLKSRAPTGETLLAGKARRLKSNSPPHARKPLKSGFPMILSARLPQQRHFETGSLQGVFSGPGSALPQPIESLREITRVCTVRRRRVTFR
jgi:hypothetical protein